MTKVDIRVPLAELGHKPQAVVLVPTTDDPLVNAQNLLAAYDEAKTLTPNGEALSKNNRVVVLLPPGVYDFGVYDEGEESYTPLVLDAEFVDIVGMSSVASHQVLVGTPPPLNSGIVVQTADDVTIANLQIRIGETLDIEDEWDWAYDHTDSAGYFPNSDLPNAVLDNVEFYGNDWESGTQGFAMRWAIEYSGTYRRVTGLYFEVGYAEIFGIESICSGTFNHCTGGMKVLSVIVVLHQVLLTTVRGEDILSVVTLVLHQVLLTTVRGGMLLSVWMVLHQVHLTAVLEEDILSVLGVLHQVLLTTVLEGNILSQATRKSPAHFQVSYTSAA
jgi:hypothetical protein